jgi:uncharacterized protein YlxP (DUF503 family)
MGQARFKTDWDKLRAAVLHVISTCDPESLGAVKLHKVLYYSDMLSYLDTGRPITGAEYRKRPFGPTCDSILPILNDLQRKGEIEVQSVSYHGFQKKQFRALGLVRTNHLSADEKEVLDEMIEFVCRNNTAKTISDFSHSLAWEMVEFGDVIPYHNAFNLVPNMASAESMAWAEEEAAKLESSGQKSPDAPLAGIDSRAFRARLVELSGR